MLDAVTKRARAILSRRSCQRRFGESRYPPRPDEASEPRAPKGTTMKAGELKTVQDVVAWMDQKRATHVKLGVTDIDGILRGKYLRREKFLAAVEKGFGFCDVVLGWDSADQLYDNVKYTGWHTAYPDAPVRLVLETGRELPFEPGILFFLAEFADKAEPLCPRALLRRVVERARAMGFEAYAALEYEFFVFNETPESVRAKGYKNLEPLTPGMFGYSVLRSSVHSDFYHQLIALSEAMDMPLEAIHTETGPGVLEAAIAFDLAQNMGDKATLFKTFVKVLAQRNKLMATFMAKWSNQVPGQSGHIHLSLRSTRDDRAVFFDPEGEFGMSETQRSFIAGQQRLLPELLCMYAQTVNSFSRLVPGHWAPTHATWGVENRTTALRVVPGSDKSQRVEVRLGSADANPYIALAAALASGLHGIEQKWQPEPCVQGNAYAQEFPAYLRFPRTLHDASVRLSESTAARGLFGAPFVEHYAATRAWEEREFQKHVTDWELARYFEII
jgi:glutamine synthetase